MLQFLASLLSWSDRRRILSSNRQGAFSLYQFLVEIGPTHGKSRVKSVLKKTSDMAFRTGWSSMNSMTQEKLVRSPSNVVLTHDGKRKPCIRSSGCYDENQSKQGAGRATKRSRNASRHRSFFHSVYLPSCDICWICFSSLERLQSPGVWLGGYSFIVNRNWLATNCMGPKTNARSIIQSWYVFELC